MSANEKLVTWLFETDAVRVCPENKPFWYTSGTIGPYYINTHFLYGSESKANDLLKKIDSEKNDIVNCPGRILDATRENYKSDRIFKGLIEEMCSYIRENIDISEIDCISGGERRDWFFSLIIAEILGKPHITIYKDMKAVISENGNTTPVGNLSGKKVLHIADLITEASSYERAWIPAIKNISGEMLWSVVVVDRKQGGEALLAKEGVKSFSMVSIDKELFDKVLDMKLINVEQYEMIVRYIKNPKDSMKEFLETHPEFLENALNADEKTKERAKLCIDKKIYG
ncbi:MAG: orotate phosphoribosyltransferase [Clostridia bacterium]|nr:orotate phosphoribosyltransferase [Clostridia bacterium]